MKIEIGSFVSVFVSTTLSLRIPMSLGSNKWQYSCGTSCIDLKVAILTLSILGICYQHRPRIRFIFVISFSFLWALSMCRATWRQWRLKPFPYMKLLRSTQGDHFEEACDVGGYDGPGVHYIYWALRWTRLRMTKKAHINVINE